MKLIIFDLDGTLVDSLVDITASVNAALVETGLPEKTPDQVVSMIGNGTRALIERAVAGHAEQGQKAFATFSQHYEKHLLEKTAFYPGVESMLKQFQSKKLAVMSNKRTRFCDAILQGLNADHYFEMIVGGDRPDYKKPNPAPLLEICRRLKVQPNEAAMVGDSPVDVTAGRAAGMFTVGITEGFTPADVMAQTGADSLLPNAAVLNEGIFSTTPA